MYTNTVDRRSFRFKTNNLTLPVPRRPAYPRAAPRVDEAAVRRDDRPYLGSGDKQIGEGGGGRARGYHHLGEGREEVSWRARESVVARVLQ